MQRERLESGSAYREMFVDRLKDSFQFVLYNAKIENLALFDVLSIKKAMAKLATRGKIAASPHLTPVCRD